MTTWTYETLPRPRHLFIELNGAAVALSDIAGYWETDDYGRSVHGSLQSGTRRTPRAGLVVELFASDGEFDRQKIFLQGRSKKDLEELLARGGAKSVGALSSIEIKRESQETNK